MGSWPDSKRPTHRRRTLVTTTTRTKIVSFMTTTATAYRHGLPPLPVTTTIMLSPSWTSAMGAAAAPTHSLQVLHVDGPHSTIRNKLVSWQQGPCREALSFLSQAEPTASPEVSFFGTGMVQFTINFSAHKNRAKSPSSVPSERLDTRITWKWDAARHSLLVWFWFGFWVWDS